MTSTIHIISLERRPEVVVREVIQGPPGVAGTTGSFEFTQGPASANWVVPHNLGVKPSVTVIDTAGDQLEGSVVYNSPNQLTISFSAIVSGTAFLN